MPSHPSLLCFIGAGRQAKAIRTPSSNIVAHIDGADAITGLLHVHVAQDIPVAQSPVQKTATLKDKEARCRSFAFKDDWFTVAAVFKKWKNTSNVAKIIAKDKASFTPGAGAVHV